MTTLAREIPPPAPTARRSLQPSIAVALFLVAIAGGTATAVRPTIAVAALVVLLLTCSIVFDPDIATLAVIGLLYSNLVAIAVKFHGVPFVLGASFSLLLTAPLSYYLLVRRERIIIASPFPLLLGFLAVQALSTMLSDDPQRASRRLAEYAIEGVALYFLVTNVVRSRRLLRKVVWLIVLTGAAMGAISLFQKLTGTYGSSYFGLAQLSRNQLGQAATIDLGQNLYGTVSQPRAAGPIGEPNRYAQVLLVLVPLALALVWVGRGFISRVVAAAAGAFITIGVFLTYSRGAAVGLVCVFVVMVGLRYISLRGAALVLLVAALLLAVAPSYRQHLWTTVSSVVHGGLKGTPAASDASGADTLNLRSRATELLAAEKMFVDNPLLGVGPDLYVTHYREYAERVHSKLIETRVDRQFIQPHDLYLGIAAETGIFGLLFFLGIFVMTLRNLFRARRACIGSDPELAALSAGFVLSVVAYMASGVFLHLSYHRFLWLLMALAAATALQAKTATHQSGDAHTRKA